MIGSISQLIVFSMIVSCTLSAAVHKHRRHSNRGLLLNSYGSSLSSRSTNDVPSMEGSLVQSKNKPISINFLNTGFMMRPEKSSQFRGSDTRFYRINALSGGDGGIRSSPFTDNSMSSALKKILLRMN